MRVVGFVLLHMCQVQDSGIENRNENQTLFDVGRC